MSLQDIYKGYIDQWGLVQPQQNTESDNGVRFSAEAFLAYWEAAKWQRTAYADESQVLFCLDLAKAIGNCCSNGLLFRRPDDKVQEGPDDYIAALAVSYIVGSKLSRSIYEYGLRHLGFYCNTGFRWNAFLWRDPSLFYFNKFCVFGKLSLLGKAVMAVNFILSGIKKDQDTKVLSWFMVRCVKGHSKFIDKAISFWSKKLKDQYPRGIGDVLGQYYSPEHFSHPNSKALLDVFE